MSESDKRPAGNSYLIRLWREPRSNDSGHAPRRVYVRDLRSGEELYLKSVDGLAAFLERHDRERRSETVGDGHATGGERRRAG